MNVDARWMLKNHKYIVSRKRFLELLLRNCEKKLSVDEQDIIDVVTYMRRIQLTTSQGSGMGSRTEYAVMNLEELTQSQIQGCKDAVSKWVIELRTLEKLESIYKAILCGLTLEEQELVKKHFDENMSLASLAEISLCIGLPPKSQSTLKRMLRTIEHKAERITSVEM